MVNKNLSLIILLFAVFAFASFAEGRGSDITAFNTTRLTPAIDLNGTAAGTNYEVTFTKGSDAVVIVDSDMTITSTSGTKLKYAEITLTNLKDTDEIQTSGVNSKFNISTTTGETTLYVKIAGEYTFADYVTALKAMKFYNAASDCDGTTREITFRLCNGPFSNIATTEVIVQ